METREYKFTYTLDQIYSFFLKEVRITNPEFTITSQRPDKSQMKKIYRLLARAYHGDMMEGTLRTALEQGRITEEEKEERLKKLHQMMAIINGLYRDYEEYERMNQVNNNSRSSNSRNDPHFYNQGLTEFDRYCVELGVDGTIYREFYEKLKKFGYPKTKEEWLKNRVNNKHIFQNAESIVQEKQDGKDFFSTLRYKELLNYYQIDLEMMSIEYPDYDLSTQMPFEIWLNGIVDLCKTIDSKNQDLIVNYRFDYNTKFFKDYLVKLQMFDQIAQVLGTKSYKLYNNYYMNNQGARNIDEYINNLYTDYLNNMEILCGITKEDLEHKYMIFKTKLNYQGSLKDFIDLLKKCLPICSEINIELSDAYASYSEAVSNGIKFDFYNWLAIHASMKLYNCNNLAELMERIIINQSSKENSNLFGVIKELAGSLNDNENVKTA